MVLLNMVCLSLDDVLHVCCLSWSQIVIPFLEVLFSFHHELRQINVEHPFITIIFNFTIMIKTKIMPYHIKSIHSIYSSCFQPYWWRGTQMNHFRGSFQRLEKPMCINLINLCKTKIIWLKWNQNTHVQIYLFIIKITNCKTIILIPI